MEISLDPLEAEVTNHDLEWDYEVAVCLGKFCLIDFCSILFFLCFFFFFSQPYSAMQHINGLYRQ